MSELEKELDSRIGFLEKKLGDAELPVKTEELERKADVYGGAARFLETYESWRGRQLSKFKRMHVLRLIKTCLASEELFMLGFPRPKDAFSFEELGDFLKSSAIEATSERLLEMAGMKVEELKKFVGDQHQFRRLASENSDWLESVAGLESSGFLSFDFGNDEKKKLLLSAIRASGEAGLSESMEKISSVSRSEFEEGKAAALRLERQKTKENAPDADSVRLEILALGEIKRRLPRTDRGPDSSLEE
jgi:hypothetical protein